MLANITLQFPLLASSVACLRQKSFTFSHELLELLDPNKLRTDMQASDDSTVALILH